MTSIARWALAAFLLSTTAQVQVVLAQTVPPQKVLRVVPSADLTQLDPGFASIVITRIYGLMVYETLFAWDSKLQPKPQMVQRLEHLRRRAGVAVHPAPRLEVP